MAFTPKFTITQSNDGKSFVITDVTGNYNVSTNPGGYGAPNPTQASITSATLLLDRPYQNISYPVMGFATTLYNTDFGLAPTTPFPADVYRFLFTLISATIPYTYTLIQPLDSSAQICLDNKYLALEVPTCSSDCSCSTADTQATDLSLLTTLLKGARLDYTYGLYNRSSDIYTFISKVCSCGKNCLC